MTRRMTCDHCGVELTGAYHSDAVRLAEVSLVNGPRHVVETEYELMHCPSCHDALSSFAPIAYDVLSGDALSDDSLLNHDDAPPERAGERSP